jgi:hypothetical protein
MKLASTAPDREDGGVQARRPVQVAADVDAASHREQRGQQHDERDVLGHQRMHELRARERRAVQCREGQQEGQRPGSGDLAVVVVPEGRRQQRHQRDREQDARERHAPQRRQRAAVEIRGQGRPGNEQRHHRRHETHRFFHGAVPYQSRAPRRTA